MRIDNNYNRLNIWPSADQIDADNYTITVSADDYEQIVDAFIAGCMISVYFDQRGDIEGQSSAFFYDSIIGIDTDNQYHTMRPRTTGGFTIIPAA